MKTTIPCMKNTKERLEKIKGPYLSWDVFLKTIAEKVENGVKKI